uniref:BAG cochaperone 4 n=1 Tax=Sphenodon punctatus TaxID=8508 RepID=A0A8D0HBC4_SPHPU
FGWRPKGTSYWNSQLRAPYPSAYPVGPELQGQEMDSSCTNGAYSAPYPSVSRAAPRYPNLPESNTYYSSDHPRAPYPAESPSMYKSPSPASHWNYPTPECPAEGSTLRRQVPGYSPPQQTPGMPMPPYPYGDVNHGIPQQGLPPQPRPQDESWAPSGVYMMHPHYSWSAPPTHGSQFMSESSPPWPGNGVSAPYAPAHGAKESSYNKPEHRTNQHNYFPNTNHQPSGTMNEHKPTQFNIKPSSSNSTVQYCAQPYMYDVPKKSSVNQDTGFKSNGQPSSDFHSIQPGIQKVRQVMEKVQQLEQEVDEFVGKKTDKAYRLLEEMLTKLLLELDSIETSGQDHIRQARKEAVHTIQDILEQLERKGF